MNVANYEKLVLSACFLDKSTIYALATELPESAFGFGPGGDISSAHRLIYRAMIALYQERSPIDVATVATKLGRDLTSIGGEMYLAEVSKHIQTMGINNTEGLPKWANIVDGAGRVRQLDIILGNYKEFINKDFEIERVDELFKDLLEEIGNANKVVTTYKPISHAAKEFRNDLEREIDGTAISWLPVGWEATKKYHLLPRSSLVTIQGLSSIGKSQILIQFMLGAAVQLKRFDLPGIICFNTYEMRGKRYVGRMASCLAGVNLLSDSLKDRESDDYRRLMEATEFIESLPIMWDEGDMSSTQIISHSIALAANMGGIHIVGIDYVELTPDKGASEEIRVAQVFRNAQSLSRLLDCAACTLSQVSGEAFANQNRIAGPWGTRYSKAGWHASEVLMEVYNPLQMSKQGINFSLPDYLPTADKAYILVHKNKNGPTGFFSLDWTPGIVRFSDPALAGYGSSALYEGLEEIWSMEEDDEFADF